ncbi:Hydroxylamine oxidoreductase (Fragment) [hydrothermal vent metagenome]|uniref:Hydroxylamine oxidoreductase n=1 Tax=hydrothermal vent metagenome TaxID=652676 RepID=A0A3B1BXK1_9ZZZZ
MQEEQTESEKTAPAAQASDPITEKLLSWNASICTFVCKLLLSWKTGLRTLFADEEEGDYNLMRYFIGMLSLILFIALTMVGYVSVKEGKTEFKPVITEPGKQCIDCHVKKGITAGAIRDWKMSEHAAKGIGCNECHIPVESTPQRIQAMTTVCEDKNVRLDVSSANCKGCHEEKVAEFARGKHSKAWLAMEVMPTTKDQPPEIIDGEKGCGGCHKIGRDEGQCDACHTRHKFSAEEARRPEACATCHMGFDHPQWEMYSTSKHGMIYAMEGDNWDFSKKIKEWNENPFEPSSSTPRAPVCVTCHMQDGDHGVMTAWGFLALRLPEDDKEWMGYRTKILEGLGITLSTSEGTRRIKDIVVSGDMARLTKEGWQEQRNKMIKVCAQCHSESWGKGELDKADRIIKAADKLMAEAIEIVEGLYTDGLLPKPENYPPHVDLLRFYEVQTAIEQKLYVMFLEHRMRTFQGAFHNNPDYMHWYGWAEMKRDLAEIREENKNLRAKHAQAAEK